MVWPWNYDIIRILTCFVSETESKLNKFTPKLNIGYLLNPSANLWILYVMSVPQTTNPSICTASATMWDYFQISGFPRSSVRAVWFISQWLMCHGKLVYDWEGSQKKTALACTMVRMEIWTCSVKTTRLWSVRQGRSIITVIIQADKCITAETQGQFHSDNSLGWRLKRAVLLRNSPKLPSYYKCSLPFNKAKMLK